MSRRRTVLKTLGTTAAIGLAGCLGDASDSSPNTLRVGTYASFIDAPSTSAGEWVKSEFESRHDDLTLEWVVPDGGLEHFFQRSQQGAEIDVDAFVGVTAADLVKADAELEEPLFDPFETDMVANADNIIDAYQFDPQQRVLPTGASYVSLVYDESEVETPSTFADLASEEYADSLLLANPQDTTTGLLFLLWTIHAMGETGYLDYWEQLIENGVNILGSWADSYAAYSGAEAPMVVSYSTDQVFAANEGEDMARHQVAFLENQGYAYVDGTVKFAATDRDELVNTFGGFMLDPEVQQQVAVENVGMPTVSNASLPTEFAQYVHEPDEPVQFGYDELAENLEEWRETWARQVVSN